MSEGAAGTRVLVVDDDAAIRTLFLDLLAHMGFQGDAAGCGAEALAKIEKDPPSVMLLDLNLPDMDGLEVLKRSRNTHRHIRSILISGSLAVEDAVEAMRHGAFHCLTKPVSLKQLEQYLKEASSGIVIHKEIHCNNLPTLPMIVASPAMKHVTNILEKVSRSPTTTVLITGETGTGKEVVARCLHHLSNRRGGNFVAVNCAAIPESLIESELFGHERGAFTDAKSFRKGLFEEAEGGTLFLDELGELPMAMQSKLLRALQERVIKRVGGAKDINVDVRVIAATNVDLQKAVRDGKFREDLFYRLMVIPLHVPPLRSRREDIMALAQHFFHQFAKEFNRPARAISEDDKKKMLEYAWPGNIRELRNCIERTVLLDLEHVEIGTVPLNAVAAPARPAAPARAEADPASGFTLHLEEPTLENAERALILEVFHRVNGNRNQAAAMLGINRTTLYRKLVSYGMENTEDGPLAAVGS
ncbi:MAG: sigma-54-dependent Fis family transcriptional regulator [Planctomycetota bacterium]|nr:sigma-54-dependent Fis family transcriptional regulator [Planctomycetota bacterium]